MKTEEAGQDVAEIDEGENDEMESDIEETLLEPRFKYSRILNDMSRVSITCYCFVNDMKNIQQEKLKLI